MPKRKRCPQRLPHDPSPEPLHPRAVLRHLALNSMSPSYRLHSRGERRERSRLTKGSRARNCNRPTYIAPYRQPTGIPLPLPPRGADSRRGRPNVGDARLAVIGSVYTAASSERHVRIHLEDFPNVSAERHNVIKRGHGRREHCSRR